MSNTIKYLDAAMKKLKLPSDNALALNLGISRSSISEYRKGSSRMDNYTATRLAQVLEVPAMLLIAETNLEREKDARKQMFWLNLIDETKRAATEAAERAEAELKKGDSTITHNAHYRQFKERKHRPFLSMIMKISRMDRRNKA